MISDGVKIKCKNNSRETKKKMCWADCEKKKILNNETKVERIERRGEKNYIQTG